MNILSAVVPEDNLRRDRASAIVRIDESIGGGAPVPRVSVEGSQG
jgi:hypothetical protein